MVHVGYHQRNLMAGGRRGKSSGDAQHQKALENCRIPVCRCRMCPALRSLWGSRDSFSVPKLFLWSSNNLESVLLATSVGCMGPKGFEAPSGLKSLYRQLTQRQTGLGTWSWGSAGRQKASLSQLT